MTSDARGGDSWRRHGLVALLLAGAVLRLWQYSVTPSLWLDEAALARNIVDRSARELLLPLDHGQAAPPGFLLVQKAVTSALGPSERALRAVPLLNGLASLVLFTVLARRTLTGGAVVYAILLFALGQPFIYFSSQAKHYAMDIAGSLLATLLVYIVLDGSLSRRARMVAAGVGAMVPFASTAAALVTIGAAAGAFVVLRARRDAAAYRSAGSILATWTIAAAAAGLLATSTVPDGLRDYLDSFWRSGYVPLGAWAWVPWLWETSEDVFGSFGSAMFRTNGGLGYRWPALFAATTILGFAGMVRARWDTAVILLGPLLCLLAASGLRLYPATGRLLVFAVPLVVLGTAAGAQLIWRWLGDRLRTAGIVATVIFVAMPIVAAIETRPPYSIQPVRTVLEQMSTLHRHGDAVYVDYAAAQAFLFYAPKFGLDRAEYVVGRCAVTDRRDYLRQIDRFRGRSRVWIIATHLSAAERSITIGYVEVIGRRIESIFVEPEGAPLRLAAYARLYDLSRPELLTRTSAAVHPLQHVPLDAETREWGCSGPLAPPQ